MAELITGLAGLIVGIVSGGYLGYRYGASLKAKAIEAIK